MVQALAPLGDMFGHKHPHDVEWGWGSNAGRQGIIFTAAKDIASGQQVSSTLGPKTNFQLLSTYGIVEPININKQPVFLRHVAVRDNDPLKVIKDDFFEFKPHH